MGKFKESQTAKNLLISHAFEAQANARYRFFAKKAKTDGFVQIANFFAETAEQEFEHSLRFFKFFNGGELEITASFLTGVIKGTYENLLASAELEKKVGVAMYPKFAQIARDEQFQRAADLWDAITIAELQHEKSFLKLADNIQTGNVFKRNNKVIWRCGKCGYLHEGTQAPDKCPACVHPIDFFEIMCEPW
ncbi:MAG: rubrerythrin family protein [Deltaproteobacteria bacterium]|nr:rubrerythrin family protein [Deltaproteobacteria bacterium]MBW2220320.1 rubrerythrin family protein [Deltaproteobacteria bacterium]